MNGMNLDFLVGFAMACDWLALLLGALVCYRGGMLDIQYSRPLTPVRRYVSVVMVMSLLSVTYYVVLYVSGYYTIEYRKLNIPFDILILGMFAFTGAMLRNEKGKRYYLIHTLVSSLVLILAFLLLPKAYHLLVCNVVYVGMIVLCIVESWRLWHWDRHLRDIYSTIDDKETLWFRKLTVPLLLLPCCLNLSYYMPEHVHVFSFLYFACSAYLFIRLAVHTLRHEQVLIDDVLDAQGLLGTLAPKKVVDAHEFDRKPQWMEEVERLMKEKHIYRNPNLDGTMLAREAGTNRTYLSRYLNVKMNQTLYDFVNGYRTLEAEKLLRETDMTIDAVAEQCGFTHRAALIKCIQQKHHMTPSQYRRQ